MNFLLFNQQPFSHNTSRQCTDGRKDRQTENPHYYRASNANARWKFKKTSTRLRLHPELHYSGSFHPSDRTLPTGYLRTFYLPEDTILVPRGHPDCLRTSYWLPEDRLAVWGHHTSSPRSCWLPQDRSLLFLDSNTLSALHASNFIPSGLFSTRAFSRVAVVRKCATVECIELMHVQVSDNVEVERIESTRQSGSEFSVGTHQVTYTVTDKAGLQSSCTFTVTVIQLPGLLLITRCFTVLHRQDTKIL